MISYEKATITVTVSPLRNRDRLLWPSSSGKAIFSKSRRTCYVFSDDVTMDTFRKNRNGSWTCFGVPGLEWEIKMNKKFLEPFTKEQFDSLFDENITKKKYDQIIGLIDDRFTSICNDFLIQKTSGSWFDYDNGSYDDEDGQGHFDPQEYKEYIGIMGEYIDPPPGYDFDFPTRWLWEDYEEELAETVQKAKSDEKNKKQKAKDAREARKELVKKLKASIKTKLTPAELKIVHFR